MTNKYFVFLQFISAEVRNHNKGENDDSQLYFNKTEPAVFEVLIKAMALMKICVANGS